MTVHSPIPLPIDLAALPRHALATVAGIDWTQLSDAEARRLREFGLDEGVEIELLHGATLGGGPLACRIGRMTITFRSHIARAIRVTV
ncbi:iron transporter FeoA [Sphingomonas sp. Leaf33]|uniref:FeoA family protein n=1 Tax=Sphingomonas sp. Leaf33 TaxID=1736215 RepID=UPI0006FC8A44|nr:FeoA family protein [Sphingomonas sp. Leaf33]KQN25068.1 iron transporter FeoA [Sphingomonas sp. Leaf33]